MKGLLGAQQRLPLFPLPPSVCPSSLPFLLSPLLKFSLHNTRRPSFWNSTSIRLPSASRISNAFPLPGSQLPLCVPCRALLSRHRLISPCLLSYRLGTCTVWWWGGHPLCPVPLCPSSCCLPLLECPFPPLHCCRRPSVPRGSLPSLISNFIYCSYPFLRYQIMEASMSSGCFLCLYLFLNNFTICFSRADGGRVPLCFPTGWQSQVGTCHKLWTWAFRPGPYQLCDLGSLVFCFVLFFSCKLRYLPSSSKGCFFQMYVSIE